eukprot:871630-Amphidinium_carterae.1
MSVHQVSEAAIIDGRRRLLTGVGAELEAHICKELGEQLDHGPVAEISKRQVTPQRRASVTFVIGRLERILCGLVAGRQVCVTMEGFPLLEMRSWRFIRKDRDDPIFVGIKRGDRVSYRVTTLTSLGALLPAPVAQHIIPHDPELEHRSGVDAVMMAQADIVATRTFEDAELATRLTPARECGYRSRGWCSL